VLAVIEQLQPPERLAPPAPRGRPDPAMTALVKRLGDVTRSVAAELQISPELLATRRDLEALAQGDAQAAPLQGWRLGVVGRQLQAAL
jgi:ribonuclease D